MLGLVEITTCSALFLHKTRSFLDGLLVCQVVAIKYGLEQLSICLSEGCLLGVVVVVLAIRAQVRVESRVVVELLTLLSRRGLACVEACRHHHHRACQFQ
jgi:hypothetical protein